MSLSFVSLRRRLPARAWSVFYFLADYLEGIFHSGYRLSTGVPRVKFRFPAAAAAASGRAFRNRRTGGERRMSIDDGQMPQEPQDAEDEATLSATDLDGSAAPRDFRELRTLILERRDRLPKRLVQVADFAIHHPQEIAFGRVAELARKAQVQPSTMIRFAQAARLFRLLRPAAGVPILRPRPLARLQHAAGSAARRGPWRRCPQPARRSRRGLLHLGAGLSPERRCRGPGTGGSTIWRAPAPSMWWG